MTERNGMRWFVRGDLDGFFGLAIDNLVQLLLINTLCTAVLGFPPSILYGRVLPAVAVSLLVGNLFYAWQARRLARRLGRTDICALPYGVNTPAIFAYVLLVMLPVRIDAMDTGASAEEAALMAWHAGLVACIGSGLIELIGSVVVGWVRRWTPRAALLSTLAGIAVTFIAMDFVFRTFAHPLVGLTTLAVILLAYFGRVKFRGGVPAGLVAVALGTALCWATGLAPAGDPPGGAGLRMPVPVIGDLAAALSSDYFLRYLTVIIPMGLFNLIGSMQNIESAEAEGDAYPTGPSLAVNGLGTLAASLFGSCFPTTIYIGHPGWKAMGARAGYSVLNGVFISVLCVTGTVALLNWAVPIEAGMAIVLWIGIVITAQAFRATPRAHAPAVVVGLLPGIAAWGAAMAKNGLRVAGYGPPDGPTFQEMSGPIVEGFAANFTNIHGALALEQGFILSAMILSAATAMVIDRRFTAAAVWCAIAAGLSAAGLMHSYRWTPGGTAVDLFAPAWQWAGAYLAMGVCFLAARWLTVPDDDEPPHSVEADGADRNAGEEAGVG